MSLFNTKKETNKQPINEIQKAKGRRAKTAQQTIPYEEVYPNGIIKVAPGLYSKSYYFGDMNFTTEKEDKQEEILKKYSKLLSKYAPNVTAQFTIFNRRTSAAKIKERFLLKPKSDDQQIFRDDYNKILADKIEEGRNDIQKERYMTLTLKTTDIIMANRTFATLDEETDNAVREINKTGVRPLTIEERICILHDIYKVGEEDFFPDLLKDYYDDENKFSLEVLRKRGLTTKDLIAPGNYMNGTMQIQLGDHNYAKTFLITNFPTAMDTSFLSEISNIPCSMLTSVIFKSYPHKKAIKDVKAQNSAIKSEVVKANQKAVKGNYDPSLISEDLLTAREEAADLVRDVTIHNQKLFFTTVTVTLLATSLDELKEYSNILQMRISDFSCQANSLLGQQTAGLKTSLPLAMNYTEIDRMLTADSIDALFPFSVQELMDKNGHFYGLNAVTQNKENPGNIHNHFVFEAINAYYQLSQAYDPEEDRISDGAKVYLAKILNCPSRYIKTEFFKDCDLSPKSIKKCINAYFETTPYNVRRYRDMLNNLDELKETLSRIRRMSPKMFLKTIVNVDFEEWVKQSAEYRGLSYEMAKAVLHDIISEGNSFDTMEEWIDYIGDFQEFLDDCANNPDGVRLSTFHGAKGLEWDYVWIRNVTYKNVPFQRSLNENGDAGLEEERRMFYVAFTRAKKEVEVSCIRMPGMFLGELIDKKKIMLIDDNQQIPFSEIEKYGISSNVS